MNMKFYTHWERPEKVYEKNSGKPSLVNRASYIPLKRRIEDLILAGQRLAEHRAAAYDFEEEENFDENFYDPTRSPNYDVVDAVSDLAAVEERLQASVSKRKAAEAAADSPQPATTPPEGAEGSV